MKRNGGTKPHLKYEKFNTLPEPLKNDVEPQKKKKQNVC